MDFQLKLISLFNRQTLIIMQNENGPCPLIAVANVLLLRGNISIHSDHSVITLNRLIEIIADYILSQSNNSLDIDPMRQQQINDVLTLLPLLGQGLDLNVKFHEVIQFEFTKELSVFDSLRIPIYHGWVRLLCINYYIILILTFIRIYICYVVDRS